VALVDPALEVMPEGRAIGTLLLPLGNEFREARTASFNNLREPSW